MSLTGGFFCFDLAHPVSVSKKSSKIRELRDRDRPESSSFELVSNIALDQIRPAVVPAGGRGGADTLVILGRPHAWRLYLAAVVPMRCDTNRCGMIQTVQLCMRRFVSALKSIEQPLSQPRHTDSLQSLLRFSFCLVNFLKKFTHRKLSEPHRRSP